MDVTSRFIFEEDGLSNLESRLEALEKQFNAISEANEEAFQGGSEEVAKQVDSVMKLESENKKLTSSIDANNKSLSDSIRNYRVFGVSINDIIGRLERAKTAVAAFGAANRSANAGTTLLSRGLRVLRVALVSTGIGAIVVALGSLVTFLTSTQKGIDAVTSVTRPLATIFQRLIGIVQDLGGGVFDTLTNAIDNPRQAFIDLGNAIRDNLLNRLQSIGVFGEAISNIFQGNFAQGARGLFDATNQLVLGIENSSEKIADFARGTSDFLKESVDQGTQLDQALKNIEATEIRLIRERARLNRITKEQNLLANDQTKSIREREAAARAGAAAQNELLDLETNFINQKIDALKLEQTFNDTSRADLKELAMLEATRDNNAQRAAQQLLRLNGTLNTIRNQAAAETKAQNDALEKQLDLIRQQVNEVQFNNLDEIGRLQSARDNSIAQVRQLQTEIQELSNQLGRDLDIEEDINLLVQSIEREYQRGVNAIELPTLPAPRLEPLDTGSGVEFGEEELGDIQVPVSIVPDESLPEQIINLKDKIIGQLGLTDAEAKAIADTLGQVFSALNEAIQANTQRQIDEQDRVIDSLETQISETESALQEQLDLRERGLRNNVEAEQRSLAESQALLERAEDEKRRLQERALRQQLIADGLAQASSLATAAASLIAANASIPVVGLVIAGGLLATVLSLFSNFKNQTASITQLREGINPIADQTVSSKGKGLTIGGGKHGSGNDPLFIQRGMAYLAEKNEILINTKDSEKNPGFFKDVNDYGLEIAMLNSDFFRNMISEGANVARQKADINITNESGISREDIYGSGREVVKAIKEKSDMIELKDGRVMQVFYDSRGSIKTTRYLEVSKR